jgi:hypothetical protein
MGCWRAAVMCVAVFVVMEGSEVAGSETTGKVIGARQVRGAEAGKQ